MDDESSLLHLLVGKKLEAMNGGCLLALIQHMLEIWGHCLGKVKMNGGDGLRGESVGSPGLSSGAQPQ